MGLHLQLQQTTVSTQPAGRESQTGNRRQSTGQNTKQFLDPPKIINLSCSCVSSEPKKSRRQGRIQPHKVLKCRKTGCFNVWGQLTFGIKNVFTSGLRHISLLYLLWFAPTKSHILSRSTESWVLGKALFFLFVKALWATKDRLHQNQFLLRKRQKCLQQKKKIIIIGVYKWAPTANRKRLF